MAIDKLVDSTKLNSCLTAEADAIRAKTGGTAQIPFDFSNSKGFAEAIAAISGGGGVQSGSFTPTANTNTFAVSVTGAVTNAVCIIKDRLNASGQPGYRWMWCIIKFADASYNILGGTNSSGSSLSGAVPAFDPAVFGTGTVTFTTNTSQGQMIAGSEYLWAAW